VTDLPGIVHLQVINGNVQIVSSHLNDAPATLYVPVHSLIQVYIDNEIATGKVEVYPQSRIDVVYSEQHAVRNAKIQISPDRMSADLLIEYAPGIQIDIADTPPMKAVRLQITEKKVNPEPYQLQEIESVFRENGILYGVDWGNIQQFLDSGKSGSCICAAGKKPVQMVPERYELRVHDSTDPVFVGIVPLQPILTVHEGIIVAEHMLSIAGFPGIDVLGQAVLPEPVRTRLPRIGKGLQEREDGNVISIRKGRVISTQQMLDVANTLVFETSLSVVDGHVQFDGDVIVHGDINEGVEIVAGGQVFVTGFVSNATIVADEGVIVSGGVFKSRISAGSRLAVLNDFKQILLNLDEEFGQFVAAAEQLYDALGIRARIVGAGKLATTLLNDKFAHILRWPKLILEWKQESKSSLGNTWIRWIDQIAYEVSQTKLQTAREIYPWRALLQDIKDRIADIVSSEEVDVDIQVKNAQHSDMESSGRIIAVGQGFYQCILRAKYDVQAQGVPGVILGCEVKTGNRVLAREIGSQAESTTTIHVESVKGAVEASMIHPGTQLSVGHWHHKVAKEMRDAHWP
jgi:uncharacterized protein